MLSFKRKIKMKPRSLKMNCHNCINLDYFDDGTEGLKRGYFCSNRSYRHRNEEIRHLSKLQDEKFRLTGKKCFEGAAKYVIEEDV